MKLKYFLRGVGVGIIFGALIMLVAYLTSGASKLSDKEIIERAENLGMVMEEDLVIAGTKDDTSESKSDDTVKEATTTSEATDNSGKEEDEKTEADIIQGTDVSLEGVVDESIGATTQETEVTTEDKTATTEENTEGASNQNYVTAKISVTSGMTSYDVALMLQDAGIIDDYLDFDNFLNENGYSTQIRINDYEFNSNMTYEEIAKALIKEDKQ